MTRKKSEGPLHVHKKTAKGRTYYYFDTGAKKNNRPILRRLPDIRDPEFGRALQAAKAARTRRGTVADVRTFDWLCDAFEASVEFKAKAYNTRRAYIHSLNFARAQFRSAEGKSWPISVLTEDHILLLRDKLVGTPGTANAVVKALGALFYWAKKPGRGFMKSNLAAEIDLLPMGEHLEWPEWLIEEALVADDAVVRLGVALLYFLGQRIGDTVGMGRGHVKGGAMHVTQEKTGISLVIPIHERLATIIDECAPKDTIVFLVNERGKPLTDSGLRQRIQKWAKGRGQKIVPHGLRKNAVNTLLVSECSIAEVSAITGQDLKTIEHYAKRRDRTALGQSAILKFERRNKSGA